MKCLTAAICCQEAFKLFMKCKADASGLQEAAVACYKGAVKLFMKC